MREKLILGILIITLVIISVFFVTAIVPNNNSIENSSNLDKKQNTLRLLPSGNPANIEAIENEDEKENEEEDIPITGTALEKASAVALNYVREGRVTDTEIGDEDGYYEIEITLNNGNEVDVHLNENFKVLSAEWEDEEDDD